MRKWYVLSLMAVMMVLVTTALLPDAPAQEPVQRIYLSLDVPALKNLNDIPPDCSNWNELWPDFGQPHHQSGYEDNNDGVVSPCDVIILDGEDWHIIWSGPTYYLHSMGPEPGEVIVEPNLAPHDPANPIGEVWHEIWPFFCQEIPIEGWEDTDGSGTITPCDIIYGIHGGEWMEYHVVDIRLNIIAERGGVSTQDDTWSRIKEWFRNLGN